MATSTQFVSRKAERRNTPLKLDISGASGSGKTYNSLLIARGLVDRWDEITVVDTENESSALYDFLCREVKPDGTVFNIVPFQHPYSPARYVEAIKYVESGGGSVINGVRQRVLIIDSATHEWDGEGGCLEIYERLGGRFPDWQKVTPMHRMFLSAILNSKLDIIVTTRRDSEHALEEKENGKREVRKVPLKENQRKGFDYEFSIVFILDQQNNAKADKDRTGQWKNKLPFRPTVETGEELRRWKESGAELAAPDPSDAPEPIETQVEKKLDPSAQPATSAPAKPKTRLFETMRALCADDKPKIVSMLSAATKQVLGRPLESFNDLQRDDAQKILDAIENGSYSLV